MLLLIAALASAQPQPAVKTIAAGRAAVIVLESASVAERHWNPQTDSSQREVMVRHADGRRQRLRLTEYQ